ncbi:hypothetical protein HNI00_09975 [Thermoleptolyngbya oregonensis NK1-22]|uniref:Uncharacterized protein n=1 Tax=Thermoleptolyngbya oregonensis NK1-22 TaxID=2547457 RepID=A0AA96Y990_9CYAN|nr:hypothetical protein [Thermoleptolyngbya oregonensis]WOB43448.1 hypothetical protein HNI00_09975 [Thermoleptolyngbya oregonensis NK1-22]
MGLIKKLLGGLFSFLGGLGKLLGLGKSSEYFLEAEPSSSAAAAAPVAEAAPATTEAPVAAPAPAPAAAVAAVAPPATDVTSNGKAPAAAAPAQVPAAKPTPEAAPAADQTFAPNFVVLSSSRSGRRRPGPSLNPFLDMARQVRPQG